MKIKDIIKEAVFSKSPVQNQPGAAASPIPGMLKKVGQKIGQSVKSAMVPGIPGASYEKDPETGQRSLIKLDPRDPRVQAQAAAYDKFEKDQLEKALAAYQSSAGPNQNLVQVVTAANGQQYFKGYTGSWHLKGKAPTDYSFGGTKITNPAEIQVLNQLLPTATTVAVKPDPRDPDGDSWILDPTATKRMRQSRLASTRKKFR